MIEQNIFPRAQLLHFTGANLPQSGGAAQPHVTAGIPPLQLLKHANYAV